jgi:ATP-dependent Clp protease ATP-binding subunit ClpA
MFERFSPSSRTIVDEARTHAMRLGHRYVGTEHLLMALCAEVQPTAPILRSFGLTVDAVEQDLVQLHRPRFDRDRAALAMLGIDLDRVRETVEAAFGPGALDSIETPSRRRRGKLRRRRRAPCPGPGLNQVPFSPRAKKCLELALRESLRLGQSFIAPEHIALGVMREGEGVACLVLARREIAIPTVRALLESGVRRSA